MKNEKQTQARGFLATAYVATGNTIKALENFNQVIAKEGSMDAVHWRRKTWQVWA
jgi:Tfp pilus assembly protein PilF